MKTFHASLMSGIMLATLGFASSAMAQEKITACLVTKTDINPFFVKMK